MKNSFTNLVKNTAKSSQNTGGGASRQITARFESAQKKNTSLISGCSAVDVPMPSYGASDEHPMSTRSASDERRWNSRVWKYVAMIFAVLVMSIANIGTAWGQTFNTTGPSSNSLTTNNITVSSNKIQDKSSNHAGWTAVWKIDGSNPTSITSTTANIYKVEFTACNNSSGTTLAKSCKVSVSTDGSTYSTLSSGVTVSGGTGSSTTSTAEIYVSGYGGTTTVTVTFNSTLYRYVRIEKDGKETWVNSIKVYTAPTALAKGIATSITCPMTVTDGGNTLNYEFYYNTSSSTPAANATALDTFTSKTPTLSGLTPGTTYYCWVRSTYSTTEKSPWTALTGSTFTTEAAAKAYSVTAESNNDSWGTAAAAASSLDASETTSITATPNTGYKFVNWAVSGTGATLSSTTDNPTTLTMGTANATVTATFRALETYTISYATGSADGVTGSKSSESKTEDVDFTLPSSAVFTLSGYVQSGWTTSDGGGQTHALGGSYTTNAAQTFYPVWSPTYTVTYNDNGKDGGGAAPTDATAYNSGNTVTVLDNTNTMTKTGYVFGGWNTEADGSGTDYNAGATFSITANTTLYAQWIEGSEATITYVFTDNSSSYELTLNDATATGTNKSQITVATTNIAYTAEISDKGKASTSTCRIQAPTSKSKYVQLSFSIASGYQMRITDLDFKVLTVGSSNYAKQNYEIVISDGSHTYSGTKGGFTNNVMTGLFPTAYGMLEGNVTIKIYGWNTQAADTYRMQLTNLIKGVITAKSSGPSVSSFSPADGATVKTGATVTIAGSTGSTVYYLWSSSSTAPEAATIVSSGTAGTSGAETVTTTGISSSATYLYAVAVKDAVNSDVASASYTIDDTAPTLSSSTPANGATDVATSGNIVLTFSENVTIANASQFTLTGGAGTLNTASASASGTAVTIPYSGLANSTTYTLSTAAGAVQDAAGNTFAVLSSISFTTAAAPIYYYKDATHYVSSTYKNPEGNDPSGTDNVALTTPWTICSACKTGVTSVVATAARYDNKSATEYPWISAYIKLRQTDDGKVVFTIASGYVGTITIKMGGYSSTNTSLTMKLNDEGDNITYSGTMSGAATTENGFAELTYANLAAGAYTLKPTSASLYISEFNITTKTSAPAHNLTATPAGGGICSGGAATIGLDGSTSGVSYQLYRGSTAIGDPVAGTGSALTLTDTITTPGTYTVKSVANASYAAATMTGSVTVSILAATSITTQPITSVNAYAEAEFTLGSNMVVAGGGLSYQWYSYNSSEGAGEAALDGKTAATMTDTKTVAGTYYYKVKVSGSCGDPVYSNMITVTVVAANTLTYNANGGTGTMSNTVGGGSVTLRKNSYTKSGYEFIGWATSQANANAGTVAYLNGASYSLSADAELFAVWSPESYKFTPASSGDQPAVNATVSSSTGGTMIYTPLSGTTLYLTYDSHGLLFGGSSNCATTVTLDCAIKQGTVFTATLVGPESANTGRGIKLNTGSEDVVQWKWDAAEAYEEKVFQYVVPAEHALIGAKTFKLIRIANAYLKSLTVTNTALPTYDLTVSVNNGEYGSVSPASVTDIPSGTTTSSSENTFTVNGTTVTATPTTATAEYTYAFDSWSGLPATVTANATVTAIFTRTPVSYTLAWNTNGGSDLAGTPTNGTTAFGTALTKPTDPTKSNYTFAGWNTANNGSGINYTGAMTMPAADATYYAKWTQTVTLDANTTNHGSGANQSATAVWNAPGLTGFVATGAEANYTVIGYFTDATGGTKVLNADGTFAADNVTDYITGGKWSRTDAAPTLYAHLQQAVQVTYNGNGDDGTGSVPTDDTDYKKGDVVTVLGNTGSLAKTDKVFNGWNTAADGSGTFYPVGSTLIMPDGDVTLYAVWNSTTETTYYYGQITINAGALKKGDTGTKQFFTNTSGTIANSTAISWSSNPGDGSLYYESDDLGSSALSTSGNWNGSSGSNRYVRSCKYGSGTRNLQLGTKIASSITFYGMCNHTSVKKMTIGGVEYSTDGTKNIFSHEFTKSGDFTGNVSIVTDGDFHGIFVITAYALNDVYDVTFDANTTADVSGMPEDIVNVPTGSKISAPLAVPTRTGYTFDRWCTDKEGEFAFIFSTGITAATTLYAKWTPIDYNVNYVTPTNGSYTISVAGGTAGSATKIANYEQTITLVATPASTSYVFSSWTITKTSDGTDITDDVSLSGQTATATFTMPAYGVTVTATFADAYALTYDANGVSAENMPSMEYHGAGATTLSATVPTADDCVFLGWNTAADGSADDYTYIAAGGDFTMPAEAETLYAQWGPKIASPAAAETLGLATGRVATLEVEASTCTGSLSYQWYEGEETIAGATGTQYTIAANEIAEGDSYAYTCRVSTDAYHYTTSPAITVTAVSECGWEELALITATGGSTATATKDGETISDGSASALISNLSTDGSAWKLGGGDNASWFGVHLESGFQVGDSVIMKIKTIDIYIADGASAAVVAGAANVKVALSADKSRVRVYESDSLPKNTDNLYLRIAVTQAMIDAGLTKDLMFYRTKRNTNPGLYQNLSVYTMQVKRYSCPGTNESKAAGNWDDPTVWSTGVVPTVNDRVYIDTELTVNTTEAKAKEVVIMDGGKLIVAPNQALIVTGTITNAEGNPTTAAELKVESSSTGNGTLIFNNSNHAAATVQMYSKAEAPKNGTWKWQYAAAPAAVSAIYNYYGGYLYKWNDGWNSVSGSDNMELFAGYCVSYPTAGHTFEIEGELAQTEDEVALTIPAGKEWVVGNSWTAPIQIKQMETTDFVNVTPTIYLFNTGMDNAAVSTAGAENASDRYAASTYVTIPIGEAGTGTLPSVISSLQGFYVANSTGFAGTLKLDYAKHVRPNGGNSVVNGPMHAPKRSMSEKKEVLTITADGSRYSSNVMLIAHEDYTFGYDPGHDGENINEAGVGPLIYTLREDGTHDDVSAIPEYEGAVVGFVAGEDSEYTFRFTYDGADIWYLNDTKLGQSTLISNENTYTFTVTGDDATRFVISKTSYNAPSVTTGVGNQVPSTKARKLMIDGILYIIREGRIYNAEGALVK